MARRRSGLQISNGQLPLSESNEIIALRPFSLLFRRLAASFLSGGRFHWPHDLIAMRDEARGALGVVDG